MFDHCLYFNTTSLARQLEREWTKAFKPFGVTPSQAFMLRAILQKKSITYTELAHHLNISKATCSRTVDGLIKLGFVSRVSTGDDGRSFVLEPLESATALHTELDAASAGVTSSLKELIGPDEFAQTVTRLKGIKETIG